MESAFGSFRTRFLLTLMVLALCVGAFAQGGTGELTGLITDQTGAVVSGVQVKLSNTATGETRSTATTAAGIYTFPALPVVGTYTLQLSAKGFKSVKVQDIIVSVGGTTSRDVKVEVGAQTETLTVEAGVQQVQTQESDLSQLVDRRVWQDMPLETRDSNQFINLFAGTVQGNVALNSVNGGTDRGAAVNGTRSGTGNYMVEGFDNNDQGLGGGGSIGAMTGGANTTISPDAIEEFRVIEHNFSAEYGKAGGFVTDTVLKSGTNQWHGSLFEYNRIQALAANSYFSNASQSKDALIRNQFGGSVGGAIVKDKTFFYFTTEYERLRDKNPLTGFTMTPDFLNFWNTPGVNGFENFLETSPNGLCNNQAALNAAYGGPPPIAPAAFLCPGAFPNEASVQPIATQLTTTQPTPLCVIGAKNCTLPQFSGALGGGLYSGAITYPVAAFGQLTLPQADSFDHARYSAKIDHKLGTNDSLTGTYLYDNGDDVTQWAGGPGTFGPDEPSHARAQNAGVTWSHTFSPTLLNQARASYTRHTANFPGDPQGNSGTPTIFTAFDVTANGWGNNPNLPQFFTENRFEYRDDLSITKGKHQFKVGAVYGRTRNGSRFEADYGGEFAAYGINDVLSDFKFGHDSDYAIFGGQAYGSWYYAQQTINPTVTPAVRPQYYRGFRANEYAAYFQDDWRVSPRLTLNLGLRWDYFGPPHNFQNGIDSNYYPGSPVEPVCSTTNPNPPNNVVTGPCSIKNQFYPVGNPTMQEFANGGLAVRDNEIWNKDTNNFGPRIGFSWDVTGRQKLVMRGGFGVAYDRMYNNIFENLRFNPPFFCFCATGAFRNGVPGDAISQPGLYALPYTTTNVGNFNSPSVFPGGVLPKTSPRAIDPNLVTAYYEQLSYGFQYEISKDLVWETDYVGTFGHKLIGIVNLNTFPGRTAGGVNPDNPFGFANSTARPNTNVSNINLRTNAFGSNYHSLQTSLRKRFAHGLSFNANYTYAKALDELSDTFTPRQGNPAGVTINPTDSFNPKLDYGPSDFNVKSRGVVSFSYELPFMKGNRWIGGWSASGIVSAQGGVPFSAMDSQVDTNKNGTFNDRIAYTGPGGQTNAYIHDRSPAHGFIQPNTSTYFAPVTCPASLNGGAWCEGPAAGQLDRNSFIGPKFVNTDISFAKKFKITESSNLSFQANFFDLFNHPNFAVPVQDFFNPQFGSSTQTFKNTDSGGVRVTQLALRFDF